MPGTVCITCRDLETITVPPEFSLSGMAQHGIEVPCPSCQHIETPDPNACPKCKGSKVMEITAKFTDDWKEVFWIACDECEGSGKR